MTVYERIQAMTKDELQKFIVCVYKLGHINQQCGVNESLFFRQLVNMQDTQLDKLFQTYAATRPVTIQEVDIESGNIKRYLLTFTNTQEAIDYINNNEPDIVKISDDTYATEYRVYKIVNVSL